MRRGLGDRLGTWLLAVLTTITLVKVWGCGHPGERPIFSVDDVAQMSFTVIDAAGRSSPIETSRAATREEIQRFVRGYLAAQDYDEQAGTTHPVRVDIALKDGTSFHVWGGAEGFLSVVRDGGWNIQSRELERMLLKIVDELRPQPSGVRGKAIMVGGPAPGSPRPVPGIIVVVHESDQDGSVRTRVRADAMGAFEVDLPPGTYTLRLDSDAAAPRTVTVAPNKYAAVTLYIQAR